MKAYIVGCTLLRFKVQAIKRANDFREAAAEKGGEIRRRLQVLLFTKYKLLKSFFLLFSVCNHGQQNHDISNPVPWMLFTISKDETHSGCFLL